MKSIKSLFSKNHCFDNFKTDIVTEKANLNKFFNGGSMMKKTFFCIFFCSILNITSIILSSEGSSAPTDTKGEEKKDDFDGSAIYDFIQRRKAFSIIDSDFIKKRSDFVQRRNCFTLMESDFVQR